MENLPIKSAINDEGLRLIEEQSQDFKKHIEKGDVAEILLKGHLLVEHYLDHTMLIFYNDKAEVHRKSFYTKVKELEKKDCFMDHSKAIKLLYALNKVRNELAHRLDFQVNRSQIDTIGYYLGKSYILKRYSRDIDDRKLLLWVMDQIIYQIYYPIYKVVMEENQN